MEAELPRGQPVRPVVSVVMPLRDGEQHLAQQLRALAAQACPVPWELVVADNGSTDGSLAVLDAHRDRLPPVLVVDASAAVGAGATRNAGVRASSGTHLVFCDADDEVAPGWLAAMSAALGQHGLVAAGMDFTRLNEPWTMLHQDDRPGLRSSAPAFLPYAFAATLGARRCLHEELGGFDERLAGAGEDRDYCYRAHLELGLDLVLVEGALVHYRTRSTPLGMYRQSRSYALANVQLYRDYRRHGLGRPPSLRAFPGWALVPLKGLLSLRSRQGFALWMQTLGWRVGRLKGCWRYRVWAP